MKTVAQVEYLELPSNENKRLATLCGQNHDNLRQLETEFDVTIYQRNHRFEIHGPKKDCRKVRTVIEQLYQDTATKDEINAEHIHYLLQELPYLMTQPDSLAQDSPTNGMQMRLKVRNPRQQMYLQQIEQHAINFGIGPAGTGKTYLAVACALEALKQEKIRRILLVRPAVEAGERLGFLPGDFAQKIDPYLRPLYDALHELGGADRINKYLERGVIELAPLAYMRGRTLSDAFIILDEAQNTTCSQMKMFLTRIGFGSKVVITGDITQIDLPSNQASGLKQALRLLGTIEGIGITRFLNQDVVRHPLVQKIVEAYDAETHSTTHE